MKDIKDIKTEVVHSKTKNAWNIIGTKVGGKYKIARVPYFAQACKIEAFRHAEFISFCFNNSDSILRAK